MRSIFLIFISLLISSSTLASNIQSVSTTSGVVEATKTKNIYLFEDIPYAEPPIDNLRWKAPRTLKAHQKISPKENNFCVQRPSNLGGVDSNNFYVGNEDCLYLDVFIPNESFEEQLPVMFWIHGGGNTSGLKDLYDFSKMVSRHNIILVRINYRLGPFGWFTHPAIQGFQEGDDKSSNFGTLDIIKALEWVSLNISAFGGDPSNVTIFGESAGGHNVLSLLVSKKAKGLFHKAISMSGYTTTVTLEDAFNPKIESSTSNYSSKKIVQEIFKKFNEKDISVTQSDNKTRQMLLEISTEDFFSIYSQRETYDEIPLLTADGIVIPKIGLKKALSDENHLNIVPTIAGYNRDEVKLWLATAKYFVDLEFSVFGSILNIPKVKLNDEDSFEAFNYYRSAAWKIRGVQEPLNALKIAGNDDLYAYRYDWDDHRRFFIADFKKLIGAAHATEIPLLAGNYDLVGGYPLSDLIYPPSFSKRYVSKNMMRLWTNFAKYGTPGESSNNVIWEPYVSNNKYSNFLVIDKKRKLKMSQVDISFKTLTKELINDQRVDKLEKCVLLFQMFTYVGNDVYDENIKNYPEKCIRDEVENFLKENASYIEY
tara:strand:- start:3193 stop:4980 length:1788 start_codon:yes stop_codon:yes gene_type:complete